MQHVRHQAMAACLFLRFFRANLGCTRQIWPAAWYGLHYVRFSSTSISKGLTAMATAANSFRLTAAEIFQTNQTQQLRNAGVLIKSYRDYTSSGNPSMTQAEVAVAAGTTQPVVSNLERGKEVPNDTILTNILTAVRLPPTCPEGKAVYETLRTIRDTQEDVKLLPKHKP